MKKTPVGLIIIVLLITAAAVLLVRHFHIKNFHTVKPGVLYTSGQPRGMDYTRLLYKYHIAAIVNVRSASEHRERNWYSEEITWVRNNGVKYFELPIERHNLAKSFHDEAVQKKFLEIMAERENRPVLLHGSSGRKRVSMLAAAWLIKSGGLSVEETVKVVEKINDNRKPTEAEIEFINQLAN